MIFLEQNWQSLVMIVGGVITWIFRLPLSKLILKQNKADVRATQVDTDTNTINNLEKSMNIYVALIDDISRKLKEKDDQIDRLIKENKDQMIEIYVLISEVRSLKDQLSKYLE